jgi:predicted acyltransferase
METKSQRLQSLDALRGFDMFWIIGGNGIFTGLATLTGFSVLEWWAGQLTHVEWNGFAFYDMIFPLFLFIAGISFPFSVEKNRQKGFNHRSLYLKIVKRGLLLVLLGLIYSGLLKFDFANLRCASVLGRIGLAWMFAALIFMNTGTKFRMVWCAGLLVFYWLLLTFVPAPDYPGAECFSPEGNFTSYFDRMFLPGKLYKGIHDPEGILGTIPAISTALMGMLTGQFVMNRKKDGLSETGKTVYMLVCGVVLVITGLLWNVVFPINKNLWTSSFVCFVGGLSLLLFSLFYYVIDVRGYRKWSFFFRIIGLNSITVYMAQRIINFRYTSDFLFGGFVGLFPENWGPFLNSAIYVSVCWLFLYFLYKQKIFLKV